MQFFLALMAKDSEIEADFFSKIAALFPACLSFRSEQCKAESWSSDSGKLALFSWTNELLDEGSVKNLWSNEIRAFTMSGYINEPREAFFRSLLAGYDSAAARRELISRTGGLYALCFADGANERFTIWNTLTRIIPVYWCENQEYIFAASKALPIHLLCENRKTPDYDLSALAAFINTGYFNNEHTPYKNVKVLAPNSELQIACAGIRIEPIDNCEEMLYSVNPDSSVYDELAGSLLKSFQPLKRHKTKISCGLTGGKDTRLSISVLSYMGIDFETHTSGFSDHPDVVIARRIADILQIPHTVNSPEVRLEDNIEHLQYDILKRTRETLFLTDGMLSAYYNVSKSPIFDNKKLILGGHGGELVRSGFYKTRCPTAEYVDTFFAGKFLRFSSFLHNEFAGLYLEEIKNWKYCQFKRLSPLDILDKYFLYYDVGRRSAAARAANSLSYYLYQPFFDANFSKLLLQIQTPCRLYDKVLYNLIKRFAAELLDIPFSGDSWKLAANGSVPYDKVEWQEKPLPLATVKTKSTFNWKNTCLSDMKEAFYEQIFCSSTAPDLFSLLNKNSIEELFESDKFALNNLEVNKFLWRIYTISVLLSNEWLGHNNSSKIVKIRLPSG